MLMKRLALLATLASLAVAIPVEAQQAARARAAVVTLPRDTVLYNEIARLNRAMEAAIGRGDVAAAARFYADDARIRGPRGFEVSGRSAIDDYWASIGNARSWKLEAWDVGGSRDEAYQVGRSTLVHGAPGQERTSVVEFVVIWKRQADGQLRIALDFYH
jgi:ketosteroid isomerase-like protein